MSKVFQLRIELRGIRPAIWRRIQVPDSFTFWDLHVAVSDAIGWADYHLHQFFVKHPVTGNKLKIGIGNEEDVFAAQYFGRDPTVNGLDVKIKDHFVTEKQKVFYEYDFGDGWEHTILIEKILPAAEGVTYPRCIGGKRAGPPEDCGGARGYERLLKILADPRHPEYAQKREWLRFKGYESWQPEEFDFSKLEFDDPVRRLSDRREFGGLA